MGSGPLELWVCLGALCASLTRHIPLLLGSKAAWGWSFESDETVPPLPTVPLGAALLDLEQTTLPGIAHLVVETMIVSDQIRPEDRASVLRTLLLKHRCPGGGTRGGRLVQLPLQEWLSSLCLNTPSAGGEVIPHSALDSIHH